MMPRNWAQGRHCGRRGMWPEVQGLTACMQNAATSDVPAGAQRQAAMSLPAGLTLRMAIAPPRFGDPNGCFSAAAMSDSGRRKPSTGGFRDFVKPCATLSYV